MVKICKDWVIRREISLKKIKGFNNYFITEEGDVFSNKRGNLKKLSLIYSESVKYFRVKLSGKNYLVHRLVADTFIPNPDNLPQVNHKDGNKLNNRVENLEWVTAGDNQRHAYNNKLKSAPKGKLNGRSILLEEEVLIIYNRLLGGESLASVARDFGVDPAHISKIKRKQLWYCILKDLPCIESQLKSDRLNKRDKEEVIRLIQQGLTFNQTKDKINFNLTQDQFYYLKRQEKNL